MSLTEAAQAIAIENAVVLAGGTDLVRMLTARTFQRPSLLVDVKGLAPLACTEATESHMIIGACATMAALMRLKRHSLDALVDAAARCGVRQTRARATVGGNVCRSSPAGETLPALLALDAQVELVSAARTRSLPLSEFFLGPGINVCEPDEIVTRIVVPRSRGGSAYERFVRRTCMEISLVAVAAYIEFAPDGSCGVARVAAGSIAATPVLVPAAAAALVGSRCERDAIDAACAAIVEQADPIDDHRGSRSFRLRLIPSVGARALECAIARAQPAHMR